MADGQQGTATLDFQEEGQKQGQPRPGAKPAGAPKGLDFQEEKPSAPQPQQAQPASHPILDTATDLAKGAGKGALSTLSSIGHVAVPDWLVGPERAATAKETERKFMTPEGTAQKIGYGGEQAAEFLVPGPAEEKLGAMAAEHLPQLGKLAAPAARIGAGAVSTGGINALHGGSFKEGAETGALFGVGGEAARAVAPSLMESALGVTKRMRGFGRTPGEAALAETRGITPGSVGKSAGEGASSLTQELETRAAQSQAPTTTAGAQQVVQDEMAKAVRQNSAAYHGQLRGILDQLTTDFSTGSPLPGQLPASRILDLKRGIGNLEKSWSPEQQGLARGTVRRVYRALDDELDRAVPGAKELNQRISSLIPVEKAAESTDRGAGFGQRVAHRVGAHTGALIGSGLGGTLGYEHGGAPGAVAGATLGLAVPELLSSPTAQLIGARALRSGNLPRIGRGLTSELLRKEPEDETR